jgi:hypothetical protein
MVAKHKPQRDVSKEARGWFTLMFMMVLFPVLFFLCVFSPIWLGFTSRW